MVELDYEEFRHIVFKEKELPHSAGRALVGTDRYYQIFATEVTGAITYYCTINSVDSPADVLDYEQNFYPFANQPLEDPFDDHDERNYDTELLEGILNQLKLLNERIEFMAESTIDMEDVESEEPDNM